MPRNWRQMKLMSCDATRGHQKHYEANILNTAECLKNDFNWCRKNLTNNEFYLRRNSEKNLNFTLQSVLLIRSGLLKAIFTREWRNIWCKICIKKNGSRGRFDWFKMRQSVDLLTKEHTQTWLIRLEHKGSRTNWYNGILLLITLTPNTKIN